MRCMKLVITEKLKRDYKSFTREQMPEAATASGAEGTERSLDYYNFTASAGLELHSRSWPVGVGL